MALQRRTLLAFRPPAVLGRAAAYLADLLVWGAVVALLELVSPWARGDGADLLALGVLVFLGLAMARAARAGVLPGTQLLGARLLRLGRSLGRRLAPRYAVAFRRSAGVRPLPDRTLLGVLATAAVLVLAFTLAGDRLFGLLALLKASFSYSLYLLVLGTVWALLGSVLVLGVIAATQWIQQRAGVPPTRRGPSPRLLLALGWLLGMIALSHLPGVLTVALVLGVGGWLYLGLSGQPRTPYLFCRRDALGRPLAIPVGVFLRRAYLTLVVGLGAIVAMGQAGRLLQAGWPSGPFALTEAIGQLAALAALLLLVRAATHLGRLTGGGAPPELPLVPTVWVRHAARATGAWRAAAEERGFRVIDDPRPPTTGFDLVVSDDAHPQRFEPRPGASREALGWQLLRRFHVVMRRRFAKRMKRLVRALRATSRSGGSGYLFCPHAWLVQGVVRDADISRRGSGSLVGPDIVGPAYAQVFSPRVRRYLGGVLRALDIDLVYWEDAIRWADLKRVFGVAFEIHDQGRGPIQARHFVGLPRVRVLVQEEQAEADPLPERPYPTPAPGHVRVLVILRDRGGEEEEQAPAPPGRGRRLPSLV